MNFIQLTDDEGNERIINLNHVADIFTHHYINDHTNTRTFDKDVCSFKMIDGELVNMRIEFNKMKKILETEGMLIQHKKDKEEDKDEGIINITHPSNPSISFQWHGGFNVIIVETVNDDHVNTTVEKGGFTLTENSKECAFSEIMMYIEENPWMDRD